MITTRIVRAALLGLAAASCGGGIESAAGPAAVEQAAGRDHVPVHVDSVFPVEEELRRFRAALPDSAAVLSGGASSRDGLVERFIAALEAGDRDALATLAITPAEFAWIYYPHSRFRSPPYELSPALVWFQLENYGSRGLNRAVERYGGRPLDISGYTCDAAEEQGPNRVWSGCSVRVGSAAGDTGSVSLFGAILEHEGSFKFVSYGNRL
jgi:hypothetical protein